MKNILTISSLLVLILASCSVDEISPVINFDDFTAKDTTYVLNASDVPAPETKRVLVEESTGVRCTNCPLATKILHDLDITYDNRLDIISIHYGGGPLNVPLDDLPDLDLRPDSSVGTAYIQLLGGVPSQPAGTIDRTIASGSNTLMGNRTTWASQIDARLQENTPVNIDAGITRDAAQKRLIIDMKLTYTSDQTATADDYYSIILLESDIEGIQDSTNSVVLDPYTFNDVFRRFMTAISGDKISVDRVKGRVIEKQFVLPYGDIDPEWVVGNMSAVIFVHKNDATEKTVIQSKHVE